MWEMKHILGLRQMSRNEMEDIFRETYLMRELFRSRQKSSLLAGLVVVNAFFENSTRTRISFEIAAKRLGADVVNFGAAGSSLAKGESLEDTVLNLEALGADALVLRHSSPDSADTVSRMLRVPVLNGGAGSEEHPSQALLDIFTMRDRLGDLSGKKVVIVGDIAHSRVAKSNLYGLQKLGAEVVFCGPEKLLPREYELLGARVEYDLPRALCGAHAVMALRIQFERQSATYIDDLNEYRNGYQINGEKLRFARPDAMVMHPGPINRDVEIASETADSRQSVILEQVENGVAIRMSLLKLVLHDRRGVLSCRTAV